MEARITEKRTYGVRATVAQRVFVVLKWEAGKKGVQSHHRVEIREGGVGYSCDCLGYHYRGRCCHGQFASQRYWSQGEQVRRINEDRVGQLVLVAG